ncbi:hypothetical protein HPB48_009792 [Haemaphysalis longicornis]|uniref:Secreted protein n=1 Tax=Haemaphysalis longicornis TaxID=44386 RepID=A0A9J6H461_HAELO|nr:hypothetical protein HPB48_009792 [Haemaphysalis longicornis]
MGSPFSSLGFLLLIFEFSFFLTGQESSVFTSSVRTPWAARSDDMRDSGKDFPTPRHHRATSPAQAGPAIGSCEGEPPGQTRTDRPPRPPTSIAAASLPRTQ